MRHYWLRVLGAFLLLKLASAIMKDAEKHLATTMEAKGVEFHDGGSLNGTAANAQVTVEHG